MSVMAERVRSPFGPESHTNGARHVTLLPTSTATNTYKHPDAMDTTPPNSATMAPPQTSSPEAEMEDRDTNGNAQGGGGASSNEQAPTTNGANGATLSAAAATSAQQPKVVQTAFIHKLYNMLEDQSIRHLISWSNSNESFVMSPSSDFSKVLSQYFKHTNISSFVRQLNMYGFHKVSDVFHTGAPESALWEFKHGNGNFKRGDLAGLREIKRRASRHTLIHRDSFSSPHKPSVISQPSTPAEPIPAESADPRLAYFDQRFLELHNRLTRTEESNTALSAKCMILSESLARSNQWNNDLSQVLLRLVDEGNPLYRELATLQKDMARQAERNRALDDPHETLLSGRQPYFSNMNLDGAPISPRQVPADDPQRRASFQALPTSARPSLFRAPVPQSQQHVPGGGPAHLNLSPRRYGSIGGPPTHSPSYTRPLNPHPSAGAAVAPMAAAAAPPPPQQQHPLASVTEPGYNLARRHTSADIRDTPGWPPQPGSGGAPPPAGGSPFDPSHPPPASAAVAPPGAANWPPSPRARSPNPVDQGLRDQLAAYEFGAPRRSAVSAARPASPAPPPHAAGPAPAAALDPPPPPPTNFPPSAEPTSGAGPNGSVSAAGGGTGGGVGAGWTFNGTKLAARIADQSAPPTRRSSMASNVHSLLNPADTAEREEEDGGGEDRKRKRVG